MEGRSSSFARSDWIASKEMFENRSMGIEVRKWFRTRVIYFWKNWGGGGCSPPKPPMTLRRWLNAWNASAFPICWNRAILFFCKGNNSFSQAWRYPFHNSENNFTWQFKTTSIVHLQVRTSIIACRLISFLIRIEFEIQHVKARIVWISVRSRE